MASEPDKKIMFPDRFSYSRLSTFSLCPRKAFYRYVMKLPAVATALLWGRAGHKGQEYDNTERAAGRDPDLHEVLDKAVDVLKEEQKQNPETKVDVDEFVEDHTTQLRVFAESGERARIQPVAGTIEAPFEIRLSVATGEAGDDPAASRPAETSPAILEGFVDVVSQEGAGKRVLVDYKVVARALTERDAEGDLQFQIYQLASSADFVRPVSFVKSGRGRATTKVAESRFSMKTKLPRLLTWLSDTISGWRRAVRSGLWPKCSPKCHWCSASTCEFYNRCYPDKIPAQLIGIDEIKPVGTLPVPEWRK